MNKYDCSKTLDYAHEHKRMCDFRSGTTCEGCPLDDKDLYCDTDYITQKEIDAVQKWSNEHPEDVSDIDVGKNDIVNHPNHYTFASIECFDVMIETQGLNAVLGFCRCNAFKYLFRANQKNGIEDIKKAKWYLDKYVELLNNADNTKE